MWRSTRRRAGRSPTTAIDWSEQRPHLAGWLGAALLTRLVELGWVLRAPQRVVKVTEAGWTGLAERLAVDVDVCFLQAQDLWEDPDRVEVPACTVGESRWLVVGRIGEVHWSAVVTYRDLQIRIISVRRSRSEEVRIYGQDEH